MTEILKLIKFSPSVCRVLWNGFLVSCFFLSSGNCFVEEDNQGWENETSVKMSDPNKTSCSFSNIRDAQGSNFAEQAVEEEIFLEKELSEEEVLEKALKSPHNEEGEIELVSKDKEGSFYIYDQHLGREVSLEESKEKGILSPEGLKEFLNEDYVEFDYPSNLRKLSNSQRNLDESLARLYGYDEESLSGALQKDQDESAFRFQRDTLRRDILFPRNRDHLMLRSFFSLGLAALLYTEGDKIISYWGGDKIIEPLERKIQEFLSWIEDKIFFFYKEERKEQEEKKEVSFSVQVGSKIMTLGTLFSASYGVTVFLEVAYACLTKMAKQIINSFYFND